MGILDRIIQWDKNLLLFVNGLGTENWDAFWLAVTNQFYWTPLYLLFFYLIFNTLGWKKGLALVLFTAIMVTFSDQFTVFLKNYFERLRPNRDPSINGLVRVLKNNSSFSFVSGHATTSSAVSLLMYLTLKKHFKYSLIFFIWPLLFSYSRMYIGVHFPLDVLAGALLGLLIGYLFYLFSLKLMSWVEKKN